MGDLEEIILSFTNLVLPPTSPAVGFLVLTLLPPPVDGVGALVGDDGILFPLPPLPPLPVGGAVVDTVGTFVRLFAGLDGDMVGNDGIFPLPPKPVDGAVVGTSVPLFGGLDGDMDGDG